MKNFSYDSIGNLLTKSDVGNYAYPVPGLPRPHGVVSVDGEIVSAAFSYDANGNQTNATGIGRSIAYNAANKPTSIARGALTLNFADDVDHQRYKQTLMQGASVTTTRYLDAFGVHVELVTSATTQWNEYLMVGGSMVGVRFLQGSTVTLRYFHQDHLGSIAVITDASGLLAEARDAYDAWGKRRNPNGTDDATGSIASLTSRGFTGEEMLASVGLVHLNGRVVACPRAGAAGPGGPVHRPHDQRRSGRGRSAQRAELEPLLLRLQQPARLYRPHRLLPGVHRHRQSASRRAAASTAR